MPKWVGNRFGIPVGVTTFYVSAVHNLFDQYYAKTSGGWKSEPFQASGGTATWTATHGGLTYRYHAFPGSANFTVSSGISTAEALVVAGGGGGGAGRDSGGGGAGGLRTITSATLTPGTYPIVVGSGGAGGPYWPGWSLGNAHASAQRGGTSSAFGFDSTGGGGRQGPSGPPNTAPGGSGAGANFTGAPGNAGNTPPVSPPQGNPGGNGAYQYPGPEPGFVSGGGGGAGAAGGAGTNPPVRAGDGGIGRRSDDMGPQPWSIPTSYGTPGPQPGRYFAGGGGGGAGSFQGQPGGGTGGAGGGGSKPSGSGTANIGGGGGGGLFNLTNNYAGGSGGSGMVFVRYIQQS